MTCIIAIETSDDNVLLGGDFLGSNGFTKTVYTESKIFKHSGMLFGYTTSFRFGQIIECILDDNTLYPPTDREQTYKWLIRTFIPKLKEVLHSEGYTAGGCAILVVNAQVWLLHDDFSLLRSTFGVSSVGSGEYHAVSSVLTQIINKGELPTTEEAHEYMKTAFEVVSNCITSVSAKYNVITYK